MFSRIVACTSVLRKDCNINYRCIFASHCKHLSTNQNTYTADDERILQIDLLDPGTAAVEGLKLTNFVSKQASV